MSAPKKKRNKQKDCSKQLRMIRNNMTVPNNNGLFQNKDCSKKRRSPKDCSNKKRLFQNNVQNKNTIFS